VGLKLQLHPVGRTTIVCVENNVLRGIFGQERGSNRIQEGIAE
jgi:hypothetical protein